MTANELIRDKIRLGSRTARRGFKTERTERDVADKFNKRKSKDW